MAHEQISIRTGDGDCPAHVFTPANGGGGPAVIFYMDGLGIRPTLFDMAQRLADGGYIVLLPDLFYRAGAYPPFNAKEIFAAPDGMKLIAPYFASTDNHKAASDTEAFLAYLDAREDVVGDKVGTTGYCMGGAISLTAQATYPDRVVASASFHGGALAIDSNLSPHLLAPKMKGRIYVAAAVEDPYYPVEMNDRLEAALTDAKVDYRSEFYEGALHGWTMADFPIYNEPQAERHWRELFGLFQARLH